MPFPYRLFPLIPLRVLIFFYYCYYCIAEINFDICVGKYQVGSSESLFSKNGFLSGTSDSENDENGHHHHPSKKAFNFKQRKSRWVGKIEKKFNFQLQAAQVKMCRENRETFSFFKVQAVQFKMVGKFRNI